MARDVLGETQKRSPEGGRSVRPRALHAAEKLLSRSLVVYSNIPSSHRRLQSIANGTLGSEGGNAEQHDTLAAIT